MNRTPGGFRSAKTTFLVLSDLDFDSLVWLPGVLRGVEWILGHPPNDSRAETRPRTELIKDTATRSKLLYNKPMIWNALLVLTLLFTIPAGQRSPCQTAPALQTPEVSGAKGGASKRININQASLEELKTLPGIGEATAQRILQYRKKNPPFRRVEELLIIRGISRSRLERIRNQICLE